MNPMEDPLSSIFHDLSALQDEVIQPRQRHEIRVKFEFQGERRVVQLRRPLTFDSLLSVIKKIYGKPLVMLFSTGGNNELKIPLQNQTNLDQVIELMDQSLHLKNLKITLVDQGPGPDSNPWNTQPTRGHSSSTPTSYEAKHSSPFAEPQLPPVRSPSQRRSGDHPKRYSPPPGTVDEKEIQRHRGSRTSLNSEGEFIPDNSNMFSPSIAYSSSTSLDSSLSSPQIGSDPWHCGLKGQAYPDEEMDTSEPTKGGTYPRRLHAHSLSAEERKLANSRTFPRIRPSIQSARFSPINAHFSSANNMSSNCSSCSSGLDLEDLHNHVGNSTSFSTSGPSGSAQPVIQHRRSAGDANPMDTSTANQLLSAYIKFPKAPTNWRKGKVLGHGAFGKVYLAYDADTGRELAVKQVEIHSEHQDASKEIKALETEIELLRTLKHERIVQYYGCSEDTDTLSIFMEFMAGGSVKDEIKAYGAITEQVTCKYARQILEGLVYIHEYHIVHRDIKGANVLRDSSGNVKLGDFGAAKRLQTIVMSSGQTVVGTPYWMSPEVIEGRGYGRRADIWSLACTVVEMLTTRPPWYQFEAMAALFKIVTQPTNPQVPPNVSQTAREFLNVIFVDKDKRPYASELLRHPWFNGRYF
ncbi:mitogen-activated protein kinase kinase kinase 2-like [Clavelina lepadiformis]|uniref:mitogen-activated protein kinase kinase kinase 2-like n=1 Tax=Clavelina lepadiformis TaxID=159417 RepID=UPI0040424FEA